MDELSPGLWGGGNNDARLQQSVRRSGVHARGNVSGWAAGAAPRPRSDDGSARNVHMLVMLDVTRSLYK